MFGIGRDEHRGIATDARERRQAPPPNCAVEDRHSTFLTRSRQWCSICRQASRHATPCIPGQCPGRQLHARVGRGYTLGRCHQGRQYRIPGPRHRPRVPDSGQLSAAAGTRRKRGDRPPQLPSPRGFEAIAGLAYLGGSLTPRAALHLRWRAAGKSGPAASRGQSGGHFQTRIGSQSGKRTRPGTRRNGTEAFGDASS